MADDYYKILGVGRNASPEEIQKAYRKLARKHHPDMNPDDAGAKSRFQEIQKAYDILNDPEKKKMFDQFGSDFEQMRGPAGGGNPFAGGQVDLNDLFGKGGAGAFGGVDLGDIFRQFGGGGPPESGRGRRSASRAGHDLEAAITVPFATAVLGGEASIQVDRGSGSPESITVKVPPGIDEGKKIRLRGQGAPGAGGRNGDLLLTIHIAPHPFFKRNGQNLELKLPITLSEAIHGGKVEVPTPAGIVKLSIPAMSNSGQRLRVKGQGVKSKEGQGDLYVELQIKLPSEIDESAKEVIRNFDSKYATPPRAGIIW